MTTSSVASGSDLTVVIPSYNSAPWLSSTVAALGVALEKGGLRAELIVVDDGSTDDTAAVVSAASVRFPGTVDLIRQPNSGRFAARLRGLEAASCETVLLLDSRVLIDPGSLAHVWPRRNSSSTPVWNGHIDTDPTAPLVGQFWEVPTRLFWGGYLRRPRPLVLTSRNFDSGPKGTTMLLAPRSVLMAAFSHARPTVASQLVSDDTKILRWVAEQEGIQLDPAFRALYRPRTTVKAFLRHAFDRGTLFVDSYAGTSPTRSIVLLALAAAPAVTVGIISVLLGRGRGVQALGIIAAALAAASAPAALARGASRRSALAYLLYFLPFVGPFWAGLVRGVIVHRRSFSMSFCKE
ncbi:glycosyltransferase family 2 protein [Microbacterium thalli]|uniref:glycosyltransferase family 2 protein n=1 Tax=Microbacterium thalli TaxID=3027921 RepID=UPI002366CEDC|nr:glycosyltransferase family A protein [Microbacterium thalli]MDD7930469.1 glycosyltransferase family A protein [Microbacterium thalli]